MLTIDSYEKKLHDAVRHYLVSTKHNRIAYATTVYDEDDASQYQILSELDEEERTTVLALREKYGEEDFMNHIEECDYLIDIPDGLDILKVDLDTPHYLYNFKIREYCQETDSLEAQNNLVEVNNDTYAKMLTYSLMDSIRSIMDVRRYDKELYDDIMEQSMFNQTSWFGHVRKPFLVTLDELEEDRAKLLQDEKIATLVKEINDLLGL